MAGNNVSLSGIEFEIKGNTDKASNSIKTLIDGLNSLKAALTETSHAAKGSSTFKEFAVSIKGLKEALNGGFEKYKKFANAIEDIAAAAELLGEKNQHISSLAASMETLSNAKISGAAFKNLADGMAAVGFSTKYISEESLSNIERMADALSKLAGVDLKGLGSALRGAASGKLEPPVPVDENIRNIIETGDQVDLLKLKLVELQAAMNAAFEKGDVSGAIRIRQQIASVEAEIERLTSAADGTVSPMDRLRAGLSAIGSVLARTKPLLVGVASMFGKLALVPFRQVGADVGRFSKGIGGVLAGFKRIVGYRLIRSVIREITQGFTEGVKDVYQWSKLVGGPVNSEMMTFAATMDDIATSLKYLKNGVGSMVAPLISALAPAIRVATDAIVEFLNVVNQLMALLTGQSGWIRATRQAQEYEEAVGGAGGAAKEALRYLAPFDELNVLPSQKQGGGGGGGEDYGGMFEEMVEFEQGILDFANRIKQAIEDSDWQGLGTLIGDKINELIDNVDFAASGAKVGKKINALFTTKYWTLETINFQKIGESVATFLNSALEEIDFATVGATITQKFTIIGDFIIGAFKEIDWELVGSSLRDFFVGAVTQVTNWMNKQDWKQLGTDIVDSLVSFFAGLSLSDVANAIYDFIHAAVTAASGLLTGIDAALFGGETYTADLDIALGSVTTTDEISGGIEDAVGIALAALLTTALFTGSFVPGVGLALTATIVLTTIISGIEVLEENGIESIDDLIHETVGDTLTDVVVPIVAEIASVATPSDHGKLHLDIFGGGWVDDAGNVWIDMMGNLREIQDDGSELWLDVHGNLVDLSTRNDGIHDPLIPGDTVQFFADVIGNIVGITSEDDLSVNVDGTVTDVDTTQVEQSALNINGFQALIEDWGLGSNWDWFPSLDGFTALLDSVDSSHLTRPDVTIDSGAKYKWTDSSLLTRAQRTFNVWANYAWVKKDELTKEQRTIGTYSNFKWVKTDALTKDQKTINTYSNFKWVKTGELTESQKTIGGMVAKFKYVIKSTLTEAQKTIDTKARYVGTIFSALTTEDRSIDATALFKGSKLDDSIKDAYGRIKVSATANIEGVTGQTTITMIPQANGGVFTNSGWKPITSFAGGGFPYGGQIFRARENGNPELVGTLNGSTAVMNNNQIVASVSAGVARAVAGVRFQLRGLNPNVYQSEDGVNEDILYRAFSRALADSTIDGEIDFNSDTMYAKMVQKNRQNTRMTGVNALA